MKGKETLNSILDFQKLHGDVHGIGYGNKTSLPSSSHINFVKSSSNSNLLPLNKMSLKLLKLRDLKCQTLR